MPVVIAELLAIIGPWVMRFFAVKGVLMVAGFLARLGLVLGTGKFVMEPLVEKTIEWWGTLPATFQCWMGAVGIVEAASIMLSGLTLIAAKQVFFSKAD